MFFCSHQWVEELMGRPDVAWDDIMSSCSRCGVRRCDSGQTRRHDHPAGRCIQAVHHVTPHMFIDGTWEPTGGFEREWWLAKMFPLISQ